MYKLREPFNLKIKYKADIPKIKRYDQISKENTLA